MKKETDLFKPLKTHFEKQGYKVNAEVIGYDIVLTKEEHTLIVETKLSFNMTLLYQAISAQKVANFVYVAIPAKKYKELQKIIHIVRELGMGLIIVHNSKRLEVVLAHDVFMFERPTNYRKSQRLKKEVAQRKFDNNIGGSSRTKIMTAYKEKVIQIACALHELGASKATDLVKHHDCPLETRQLMYHDALGWFYRPQKGLYDLTPRGKEALNDPAYKEIVDFYLKK